MDANWFCQMGDREYGPLNLEQIRRMVARGQVTPASSLRQGKDGSWVAATQVPGLFVVPVARVIGYSASAPAPAPPPISATANDAHVAEVARLPDRNPATWAPENTPAAGRLAPRAATAVVAVTPAAGAPPVGLPVGVPVPSVSSAPVGQIPFGVVSVAPENKSVTKSEVRGKRKDTTPIIVMGVAGVLLVVVAVVAVVVMQRDMRPVVKSDDQERAAAKHDLGADDALSPAGRDTPDTASRPGVVSVEKILNSVGRWTDATKTRKLQGKTFQVRLLGLWNGPQGLFVAMQIKNPETSGATLTYTGWNRGQGATRAVLADEAGHTYSLLPVESGTDSARKTAPVELRPGDAVEDVLVFAKPSGDANVLQLALSYEVVGQGDRYFGFKIPKTLVSDERPETPEFASSDTRDSRPNADARPTRDPNAPPSLAEINRQLEANVMAEEVAQEKARKAKAAEREKEAQDADRDKKGSTPASPK